MAVIKRRKAKPMIWHKYTIHTTEEAEDAVSYMLYELGITSIEINDRKPVDPESNGGLFGDVVPEMPEDDHLAEISFYTYDREDGEDILVQNGVGMAAPDDREDSPELIAAVKNGLEEMRSYMDIGAGTVTERDTADEDWANNWKKHFHSSYPPHPEAIRLPRLPTHSQSLRTYQGLVSLRPVLSHRYVSY